MAYFTLVAWLDFFKSIFVAYAWPVVILVVLLRYQNVIDGLLKKIRKISYGAVNLELDEALAEAKADAKEAGIPIKEIESSGLSSGQVIVLSQYEILHKWSKIENLLLEWAKENSQRLPINELNKISIYSERLPIRRYPAHRILKHMLDLREIPMSIYSMAEKLRLIRNRIAHDPELILSENIISNYLALGDSLIEYLQGRFPR